VTNNPGDLTGDVAPRKEVKDDPNSAYRQDKRIWGDPIQRGKSPGSMSPVAGSTGLSPDNTAVPGYAARGDLAIFADRERGRRGLKEWIQKYYGNITLAESVKLHLGPTSSHVKGVDDPEKYPKLLQQYLTDKGGYPADYVRKTKGTDVKEGEWNDVIDAFGYAEGFYSRRESRASFSTSKTRESFTSAAAASRSTSIRLTQNSHALRACPRTPHPRSKTSLAASRSCLGNAPKARNSKARGKREARRPWYTNRTPSSPEGGVIPRIFRPFRPERAY
jgi:hypothetical protein